MLIRESISGNKHFDLGNIKVAFTRVCQEEIFRDVYFAPRPPSERLINKKLELRNMNIMRDWKVALKEYINDYYLDHLKEKNIYPVQEQVTS